MVYRAAAGIALAFFIFFLALYRSDDPQNNTSPLLNEAAPGWTLPEVHGGEVGFDSYRGSPVLLVFWSMASPECRRELSLVSQLAPEFRSRGIAVVGIHIGDAVNLRDYLQGSHIAMTSLIDSNETATLAYHVHNHRLILVSADGRIQQASDKVADEAFLRNWIDLAGK